MTNALTVRLRGASGTSYSFLASPWGTQFYPAGAVYAVMRRNQDGRFTVLYVGQTGDVSERFDSHHKRACFDQLRRTHIGLLMEPSESRRRGIEADLVAGLKPVCND